MKAEPKPGELSLVHQTTEHQTQERASVLVGLPSQDARTKSQTNATGAEVEGSSDSSRSLTFDLSSLKQDTWIAP